MSEDLESYYRFVQIRRFNDNSMVKTFLDNFDLWVFPSESNFDKSWVKIMLGIFGEVNTVQDTRDVRFQKSMNHAIYEVIMNEAKED